MFSSGMTTRRSSASALRCRAGDLDSLPGLALLQPVVVFSQCRRSKRMERLAAVNPRDESRNAESAELGMPVALHIAARAEIGAGRDAETVMHARRLDAA